jgi:hypothetical protein
MSLRKCAINEMKYESYELEVNNNMYGINRKQYFFEAATIHEQ